MTTRRSSTGYISGEDQGLPISHGQILSFPFSLPGGVPFSINLARKNPIQDSEEPVIDPSLIIHLDCMLMGDLEASPWPIMKQNANSEALILPPWTPRTIILLEDTEINQEVLTWYRIFWQAGKVH